MAQPLLGTSSGLAARPRQPRMGNNTTQLKEARVPPRGCAPSATSVVPNASVAVPRLCSSGRLRGVLFDVDGTLLNSDPLHFKVFQELFREQGFQGGELIDETFFNTQISGRHNPDIFRECFPDRSTEEHQALAEEKEARFRDLARSEGIPPTPGLKRLTEWLTEQGVPCAAVTNAPRANAELMIEAVGLANFFKYLVVGEECSEAKPSPVPYLEGLRLLGIDHAEAFAVEDSPSGAKAAIAAKLPLVGITTVQPAETLIEIGAVHALDDFEDAAFWVALESLTMP